MPAYSLKPKTLATAIAALLLVGGLLYAGWRIEPERIREWQENAPVIPFFLALAILPLLGVPTTPFFMMSGAAYGITVSLIGTAFALALNLILSYAIARGGLSPLLRKLLARRNYRLPDLEQKKEIQFTLGVRMVPAMPNFVKNYLLCLAEISFKVYFSLSMLISMLYAAPFIVMGESILEQDPRELVFAALLLVALGGLTHWLRKKYLSGAEAVTDSPD